MAVRKILRKGDRCPAVAVLQGVFITGLFMRDGDGDISPCGNFGGGTEAGVMVFQRWAISRGGVNGLVADGEVAGRSFEALRLYLGVDLESLPDEYWPQE